MDLNTVLKALSDEGIHVCPICGTPFEPYHSRQKTCGAKDCKRKWHNHYVSDRTKQIKAEHPEEYRKYHADANRKWRNKKKDLDRREAELKQIQERWEREEEFSKKIAEYGHEYGKRSAEKLLATVPKIDVTMGGKNDDLHNKDDGERG